jgi:hypothetical protein
MGTKTKAFDCVAMKRRAQEQLLAEYDARRAEFPSYVEFLNAKAERSELARLVRAKIAGQPSDAPDRERR